MCLVQQWSVKSADHHIINFTSLLVSLSETTGRESPFYEVLVNLAVNCGSRGL